MTERSLQEQIPHNHCFGCGPRNEFGLTLQSYWSGEGSSVARFRPQSHHCAGPRHFVNGGIISTLIDCHCVCTATAAAYLRAGRCIGSAPHYYYATAGLAVTFARPVPIDAELVLHADVVEATDRGYVLQCILGANDRLCANGRVEAVQVSEAWMTAREQ